MLRGQRFGGLILPGGGTEEVFGQQELEVALFDLQKQTKHDIHLLKQLIQIVAAADAIKTVTN